MDGRGIDLGGGSRNNYSARPISVQTYRDACIRLGGQIFGGTSLYAFGADTKAPPPLGETFTWGIYAAEELIGWSFAYQQSERAVYMADTGILPGHQGRGLYTRLLPHLLDTFRAAGYTLVQSHHRATNNAVIIPKLRAGFFIQGLNLYEGGMSVPMTLSLDDTYRDAMHVRSGFQAARGEVARRLGLPSTPQDESGPFKAVPLPEGQGDDTDLGGGYFLRPVAYETYYDIYIQLEDAVYSSVSLNWPAPALPEPVEYPRYAWLIGHQNEVVGWHYSRQWDARTAYMVNTALLPAHRGRGLYPRVLPPVLRTLQTQGYDLVRSHHHATNNAVLIPKMRAGFCLQGLQVDDHGVMAVLMLSFGRLYRDYMDVRSGLKQPGGEVARALGMNWKP